MDTSGKNFILYLLKFYAVLNHLDILQLVESQIDGEMSEQTVGKADICENQEFTPSCHDSHVIIMTQARYGRMKEGGCVKKNYGSIGCGKDVLELVDARCSGRKECAIQVPDPDLSKDNPCPNDLKPYLEVNYKCVKVHSPHHICTGSAPITLPGPTGYLSSDVTASTSCGSRENPWVVSSKHGQAIRLTMYDFTVASSSTHPGFKYGGEGLGGNGCHVVATVTNYTQVSNSDRSSKTKEGVTWLSGDEIRACGGLSRERVLVETRSTRVEISLNFVNGEDGTYVFKYEVLGCADPPVSAHSYITRSGTELTIRCNHSAHTSVLRCERHVWVGNVLNCTAGTATYNMEQEDIPFEVSILIVIIIALVIGLVVLIMGLLCLKSRQHSLCPIRAQHDANMIHDKDYVSTGGYYQTGTYMTAQKMGTGSREILGSEMPRACTPLIGCSGTTPRESPYGHLPADRLACGCPAYMTRDEMQNQQNIHNQAFPKCTAKLKNPLVAPNVPNTADILQSCQLSSNNNSCVAPADCSKAPDMLPANEKRRILLSNGGPNGAPATAVVVANVRRMEQPEPPKNPSTLPGSPYTKRVPTHSTFKPNTTTNSSSKPPDGCSKNQSKNYDSSLQNHANIQKLHKLNQDRTDSTTDLVDKKPFGKGVNLNSDINASEKLSNVHAGTNNSL